MPDLLTIASGAYIAGLAGELAQKEKTDVSMIASDTIKKIPNAIKEIRKVNVAFGTHLLLES